MKKKKLLISLLYYILLPFIYAGILYGSAFFVKLTGQPVNLGTAIAITYMWFLAIVPVSIFVLMRFSLLKWYVDPFAAAALPFFYYINLLVGEMKYAGELQSAIHMVSIELGDDGNFGWIALAAMFLFGLLASLSFARKRGESISFRLLAKVGILTSESN